MRIPVGVAIVLAVVAGWVRLPYYAIGPGPAREVELSSPWDLVLEKGILYIAMAGSHQIWAMNLQHGEIGPYAGSGREARIDGPLMQAALAQPSGIAADGTNLYVADSEISSIRATCRPSQPALATGIRAVNRSCWRGLSSTRRPPACTPPGQVAR